VNRGGPEEADLASAQRYELKGHRLCGNCWVEGWPANARARSLDGLRLRLDLRLEPLEATKTESDARGGQASATVTEPGLGPVRGFTQRIASRALSVPRSVQALSMAAGLGAVLVSLAIWNTATWNTAAPPPGSTREPVPVAASSRVTAASSEAVAMAPSAVDAGSSGAKASAPLAASPSTGAASASTSALAPAAAAPALKNCPEPSVEQRTAGTPGAATRTHARGRVSLDGASQHPILASTRREASAAASSAEADLLYLFSDIR
jgi:hypothetical protein